MTGTVDPAAILAALECDQPGCKCHHARRRGSGKTHCPCHPDPEPSLSVRVSSDGYVSLHCFGGCRNRDIVRALQDRGLWPRRERQERTTARETRYELRDTDGALVAVHVRLDGPEGKRMWWESPDGRKGLGGRRVEDLPLYGVHRLGDATEVIVTEGEKAADALLRLGLPAVGTVCGASTIPSADALRPLASRTVYLWPDADDAGATHMHRVAERLLTLGCQDVRVIEWPDAPARGDAADLVASGGTVEDVRRLMEAAQRWSGEGGAAKILSAVYIDGVAAERNWWRTARELSSATPSEVAWVAKPWVARGAITEIDGKIKAAGKTTFLLALSRAVLDGAPFLGVPTDKSPVVYLTEQPDTSFYEALRRAGLRERDDFHVLSWHLVRSLPWPDIVEIAVQKAVREDARLIIIDTIAQFAGLRGDTENDAGAALQVMQPLQAAVATHQLGLVFARHERKAGGEVGDSGRGSSAFAGAVDIIVSLRRGEGNTRPSVRVLQSLSRFEATPDTLVVELQGEQYVVLGTPKDVAQQEARAAILEALPTTEAEALTLPELVSATNVRRTVAQETIAALLQVGTVARAGAGKRGDPYRYWRPEKLSAATTGVPAESKSPDNGAEVASSVESGPQDARFLSAATTHIYTAERNMARATGEGDARPPRCRCGGALLPSEREGWLRCDRCRQWVRASDPALRRANGGG